MTRRIATAYSKVGTDWCPEVRVGLVLDEKPQALGASSLSRCMEW